jgi:hypothetical protein
MKMKTKEMAITAKIIKKIRGVKINISDIDPLSGAINCIGITRKNAPKIMNKTKVIITILIGLKFTVRRVLYLNRFA